MILELMKEYNQLFVKSGFEPGKTIESSEYELILYYDCPVLFINNERMPLGSSLQFAIEFLR